MKLTVILALFMFVSSSFSEQMIDRGAKINFFVGKVTVKKGDEKEWKDAKIGMKLSSKDAIRTYVESKVDIETPEGSIINIMENTVFELTEVFQNARTKANSTTLNVKTGSVWANVKKLANQRSSFTFETPTATAAIRGTELGVEVVQGRTNVTVKEGKVEVQSRSGGQPVYVFENQMATVLQNQGNIDVRAIKPDSLEKARDELLLDITSPVEGQEFSSNTITIMGKTAPGAVVKVMGGTDLTAATDGQFAGTLVLPDNSPSDQSVVIAAIFQGKTASRSIKFVLKKSGPQEATLAITEPADGAMLTTPVVQVSGITTPGATIVLGDGTQLLAKEGSFTSPYKLAGTAPGTYEIKATATLGASSKAAGIKVMLIEPPKELAIIINRPSEGEEFTKTNIIPVEGFSLPNAKVTFGSGTSVTADAQGNFKGAYELPKKLGDYTLDFIATAGSITKKVSVKVKLSQDQSGCAVEILEPANGADAGTEFTVKGKVDNPDGKSQVYVNGMPATVTGNAFTVQIASGFQKSQTGALQLTVLEPKPGAKLNKLPIMVRGKVFPSMAKVLLDGTKEARVFSDGAFEAEYPMSDETGDYTVEVSAVLESGESVKKKFDVVAISDCNGLKSQPQKVTVNVDLGASTASGEKKTPVSFHYEKLKYPLQLTVSAAQCVGDKIIVDVKTNAVELKANDKIVPLSGAGGTVRSYRYEVGNSDKACFNETEVTFVASDESAEPPTKEQRVSWSCDMLNLEKPSVQFMDLGANLVLRVFDRSFQCERSEEEVQVSVEATGQGVVDEFEVTSNGGGQAVKFVNGVNILYTIKAVDKGKNTTVVTYNKAGYLDRTPTITPLNPPQFDYPLKHSIKPPPNPADADYDNVEVPIAFKIDNIEDYKLIKRVEFRPSVGSAQIFEGSSIPTDLEFDNIVLDIPTSREFNAKKGQSIRVTYTIRVVPIVGNEKTQTGSITLTGN